MSRPYRAPGIRPPEHWSRRVRSAIVRAASMATIAFARALARAANRLPKRNAPQTRSESVGFAERRPFSNRRVALHRYAKLTVATLRFFARLRRCVLIRSIS